MTAKSRVQSDNGGNSGVRAQFLWGLILMSAVVVVPVHLTETVLFSFSPYDVVIVALAGYGFYSRGNDPVIGKLLSVVALAAVLVIVHSLSLYLVEPEFDVRQGLRELVKILAIMVVFSAGVIAVLTNDVSRGGIAGIVAAMIVGLAGAGFWHWMEGIRNVVTTVPRTTIMVGLLGLLFLFATDRRVLEMRSFRMMVAGVAGGLALLGVVMLSKLTALVAAMVGGTVLAAPWVGGLIQSNVRRWLPIGIAAAGFALVLMSITFVLIEETGRIDGFGRSVSVRLELWRFALSAGIENYGFGIGLGQFRSWIAGSAAIGHENHAYAHSLPLSLFAAFGIPGIVLFGGIVVLCVRALGQYEGRLGLAIGGIMLGPLALAHDVEGVRIILFILAFGIADRIRTRCVANDMELDRE